MTTIGSGVCTNTTKYKFRSCPGDMVSLFFEYYTVAIWIEMCHNMIIVSLNIISEISSTIRSDMRRKRYLSKAPIHQLHLDVLTDVFPDATLIYTYRPLTEVLASNMSLIRYGTEPFGMDTRSEEFMDR